MSNHSNLGMMLNFLKQPSAGLSAPQTQMPGFIQEQMREARQQKAMEQAATEKEQQMNSMAAMAEQLYGKPGSPAVDATPDQLIQSPNEMAGQGMMQNLVNTVQQGNPGSPAVQGTGRYDESIPEQERLTQFNQRLLSTGQPAFIRQWAKNQGGMQKSIMDKVKALGTAQLKIDNPSLGAYSKNAVAMGFPVGTPEHAASVKQQTEQKMFEKGENKPFSVSDLKSWNNEKGETPTYGTPKLAREKGWKLKNELAGDAAGKFVMLDTSIRQLPIIDKFLKNEEGEYNPELAQELAKYIKLSSFDNVGGDILANMVWGKGVQQAGAAFETGIQAITRTETGAAMAASEINNTRRRFAPAIGEDISVTKQKYEAFQYFLKNAVKRIDSTAKSSGLPPAIVIGTLIDDAFEKTKPNDFVEDEEFNDAEFQDWRRAQGYIK